LTILKTCSLNEMKRILLIVFISFVVHFAAKAQLESNIWYFGFNAGISFSTNPPSLLTDGAMSTREGCSSICDITGNLLFYTNGETVWNKLHQIMDNGTGLNGSFTSTQSAIILPKPANNNIYYIFTVDYNEGNGNKGLQYSEVDISMNAGLGKVITKNTELIKSTSEKQTIVKHSNNIDYWVITHGVNSNNFYSFLISSNGVNITPVISPVGSFQNSFDRLAGCLKASSNSKYIASVKIAEIELFDFDNSNGMVSNALQIGNNDAYYGVEFSADNNKLYVSTNYFSSSVYQYNLLAANIQNSKRLIYNDNTFIGGALQIGLDKKIYFSKVLNDSLGVINNPDDYNCNFVMNAVYLGGKSSFLGLPNIISSMIVPNCKPYASFNCPTQSICKGDQVVFNNTTHSTTSQKWLMNGLLFDTIKDAKYTFNVQGNYIISLIAYNDTCSDTANIVLKIMPKPLVNLGADITICQGVPLILNATNQNSTYIWQDSSISPAYNVTQQGLYWVKTTIDSCSSIDSIYVIIEDCEIILEMPNFFSPNNDGVNDMFLPSKIKGIQTMNTLIYNRWGKLVFTSEELTIKWDGKTNKGHKVADGVYYWIISYTDRNNSKLSKNGSVTILR